MKRFGNILLIVDEQTDYTAALKRGVALAKNNRARLTICAIVDTIPSELQMSVIAITPREVLDVAETEKREWLGGVLDSVDSDGLTVDSKVLVGKPFIAMIRQVLRNKHDLIIKCAEVDAGLDPSSAAGGRRGSARRGRWRWTSRTRRDSAGGRPARDWSANRAPQAGTGRGTQSSPAVSPAAPGSARSTSAST